VIWWQHEQDLNRIQDLGDDSADQPGTGIGLPLKKLRAEQGKIHEDQTGGREISEKQAAATPKTLSTIFLRNSSEITTFKYMSLSPSLI
jgi:hypothetical protein